MHLGVAKMKTGKLSERLAQAMREKGLRQADVLRLAEPHCASAGVKLNRSDLSQYVNGKVEPSREKLAVLSRALDVPEPWLMGYDGGLEGIANLIPIRRVKIPLLGSIAAGEPIRAEQEYDTYVEADADARSDYALRVDGDSMEPTILRGDLVFIRQQDDVDDGEIAAVLIDDSATLKRVYHVRNGLTLTSDNLAKYPPRMVTYPEHDTIRILGKAVAYKRML